MGYLKEHHKMTLLGNTPPGTCTECGIKHDHYLPHDRESLVYQYIFYDQHGRWPIWEDAMAHCTDKVKEYWREALVKRGIKT